MDTLIHYCIQVSFVVNDCRNRTIPIPPGEPPYGIAKGPYPTVVTRRDGGQVLVVQVGCYTQYLGNLTVNYDDTGNVVGFSGQPIFLNASIKRGNSLWTIAQHISFTPRILDPGMDELLESWKVQVDSAGEKIVGTSVGDIDRTDCKIIECPMGNFIGQAMSDFVSIQGKPNTILKMQ